MEAPTPTSTADMFQQLHPSGGPNVSVWALNRPEDDGTGRIAPDPSMVAMTEDLCSKLDKAGKFTKVTSTQGGSVTFEGTSLNFGHTLYVTGHSLFKNNGTCQTMAQRSLGGYPVDAVVDELARAVYRNNLQSIEFWCCETGCTNAQLEPNQPGKIHLRRFDDLRGETVDGWVKSGSWANVSTLDYVCLGLAKMLTAWEYDGNLQVTAVNGVGLVEPGKPYIRTFDQGSMHMQTKDLAKAEKTLADLKEISRTTKGKLTNGQEKERLAAEKQVERLSKALEDHVSKRSCHFVSNFIDLHSLSVAEAKPDWLDAASQKPRDWVYSGRKK